MAEAVFDNSIAESILTKIQAQAYKTRQAGVHNKSLIDTISSMDESIQEKLGDSTFTTDELKTEFVKAAQEEAQAMADKEKADAAENKRKEAIDKESKKQRIQMMSNFEQLGNVLRANATKLGEALKEDFKQITGGLSLIAEAPGIKSIIAIITGIASTLGSLLLINIKNSGILGKTISGLIGQDEDGNFDPKQTMENIKEKFTPGFLKKKKDKDGNEIKSDEPDQTILEKSVANLKESTNKMGETFKSIANGIKHPIQTLKKAGTAFMGGIKSIGASMMKAGASLMSGVKRLAISVATFAAGMLASAASVLMAGLTMLAPVIIIGLAVAALIFGVMYLRDKFIENKDMIMARWEMIKEGFKIALDGLVLWKDKAVTFISNTFKSIWLGLKSLFATVMTGLENGINMVIKGINKLIPGERYDLDPVDIGAKGMRQKVDEEKAAFEVEKAGQAEEFAEREKSLADRKSNNTMERAATIVQQTNQTVNEASSSTTIVPSGTEPQDSFASNMALAQ